MSMYLFAHGLLFVPAACYPERLKRAWETSSRVQGCEDWWPAIFCCSSEATLTTREESLGNAVVKMWLTFSESVMQVCTFVRERCARLGILLTIAEMPMHVSPLPSCKIIWLFKGSPLIIGKAPLNVANSFMVCHFRTVVSSEHFSFLMHMCAKYFQLFVKLRGCTRNAKTEFASLEFTLLNFCSIKNSKASTTNINIYTYYLVFVCKMQII